MEKDDETRRHASMDTRGDDGAAPGGFAQRWQPLRAQLSPLIGENGFAALFGRAVSLTTPQFGDLAPDTAPKTCDQWFAAIEQRLASIDPGTAHAAGQALTDAFTRQLTGLIGAALTERLLAAAADGGERQEQHRSTRK